MPRYGPPPEADTPPPRPDEPLGVRRWSWRAKALAVIATFGTVVAFVFEFLPPTNNGPDTTSTTVVVTTSAPPSPPTSF